MVHETAAYSLGNQDEAVGSDAVVVEGGRLAVTTDTIAVVSRAVVALLHEAAPSMAAQNIDPFPLFSTKSPACWYWAVFVPTEVAVEAPWARICARKLLE